MTANSRPHRSALFKPIDSRADVIKSLWNAVISDVLFYLFLFEFTIENIINLFHQTCGSRKYNKLNKINEHISLFYFFVIGLYNGFRIMLLNSLGGCTMQRSTGQSMVCCVLSFNDILINFFCIFCVWIVLDREVFS